jgi:carboxymethylenebutenolidase
MPSDMIEIDAKEGGAFESYLVWPEDGPVTGIVVASAIFGVNADMRQMIDDLAAKGFVVSAPDLFWRGDKGPMPSTDDGSRRAAERAQPRVELIEQGVQDIADAVDHLKAQDQCNGKIGVIGFCYGGPYAMIGSVRLGCDAGISFHGTDMGLWFDDFEQVRAPLSIHWGDEDHVAPPEVIERFRKGTEGRDNVALHIYPGVKHGYTSRSGPAFDAAASTHSWEQALGVLKAL